MAKIENLSVYPLTSPSADDFLVGTDTSNDNRTVSFRVADIAAAGALQGLQSVLDTGNTATQSINLTGNITVVGTVYPTTITAAGTPGTAGQILSSTGTGIQWINASADQDLQSVLTVGNTTTLDIITSGNITSTGSLTMNGAAQNISLSNGVDIALGVGSDIITFGNINLVGSGSVLNFGTTAAINDYSGATGTAGQILTVNGAGTGIEWSTGLPSASMPTLQQVLTAGNTATGIGMAFSGVSTTTFSASSGISSAGTNVFSGNNGFSANGITTGTAAINLTGSLSDGVGTGTAGQLLTSTATGVSWADLSTVGVASLNTGTPTNATNPLTPLTVTPNTGLVVIQQRIYSGGSLIGCVPAGGTASNFLRGDGTWATPTGNVSTVSAGAATPSTGNAITIAPVTGPVVVTPNSYAGGANVGHVPAGGSATTFLRGDGTWVTPTAALPEYNKYLKFANSKWTVTAGKFHINPGVGDFGLGQGDKAFITDHGANAPSIIAVTDERLAQNIIAANTTAGCSTFYPNMRLCRISYQWFVTQAADYTFEVWKVLRTGGLATATPAASATVTTAASTLTTGDFTVAVGTESLLSSTDTYILTVRSNTTFSNQVCSLGLTLKFQGEV